MRSYEGRESAIHLDSPIPCLATLSCILSHLGNEAVSSERVIRTCGQIDHSLFFTPATKLDLHPRWWGGRQLRRTLTWLNNLSIYLGSQKTWSRRTSWCWGTLDLVLHYLSENPEMSILKDLMWIPTSTSWSRQTFTMVKWTGINLYVCSDSDDIASDTEAEIFNLPASTIFSAVGPPVQFSTICRYKSPKWTYVSCYL